MCWTHDEEWRQYCWRNAATRETYLVERMTVDARYSALFPSEKADYEEHVLTGQLVDEYEWYGYEFTDADYVAALAKRQPRRHDGRQHQHAHQPPSRDQGQGRTQGEEDRVRQEVPCR